MADIGEIFAEYSQKTARPGPIRSKISAGPVHLNLRAGPARFVKPAIYYSGLRSCWVILGHEGSIQKVSQKSEVQNSK